MLGQQDQGQRPLWAVYATLEERSVEASHEGLVLEAGPQDELRWLVRSGGEYG